ncbi:pyruvate dehydrogenase complex E1 component subunit beta [Bartonella sp. TP]|uniref:pyruvate dehydrogenase complex E1 component subunit beta n=1 Tax=Bartonella sp. TP TaxID=3057550 RepID=UPI0025AF1B04|nr:pyruvate dehydrogenase complex E1 component subunit beta [Bartonella sp. TP]WJW80094.1 pyruvate dehydrogenase complex E1 component subunit beta [Bartonella sp. TP]
MAIEILMPALSPTMEQGKLVKWLKKEGDQIKAGDVLAEIETDKAIMEFEAVDEGVLSRLLVPESSNSIKVNSPIAILTIEGEGQDKVAALTTPLPTASIVTSASTPAAASADSSLLTVREALNQALAEEMRRDETVFLLGEEVAQYQGAYKVSQGLLEEFGEKRVVDTPITEYGFAGLGVGAAFVGLRPVVEFMTFNFAMQAIDHIINSAAKTRYMSGGQIEVPIVFRGPNGAAARVGAQHSQCYAAWYSHIPGLKVVMPYSAADAKGLLKAAIRENNPVIFLENELLYGHKFPMPDREDSTIEIGKASVYKTGQHVTIVSFGIGMHYVVQALPELTKLGIDAEIIDLRTIRPMDLPTVIDSVKKTGRLITVEEGFPQSSVGEHIATRVMQEAFDYLDAPILTIAGKDVPMPYAANLEKLALPNIAEIISAAKAVTYTG